MFKTRKKPPPRTDLESVAFDRALERIITRKGDGGDGEMAMKCPNCGADNADTSTYCQNCAGPLEPIHAPEKADTRSNTKLIIAVVIVSAIVILAGFVGVFYAMPPRTIAVWVTPSLSYNPGDASYEGEITVHGIFHNSGNVDAYPVLHYTIADRRGWSVTDNRSQGVLPAGGALEFWWDYTWPHTYNGIELNWSFQPYFAELTMTVSEA